MPCVAKSHYYAYPEVGILVYSLEKAHYYRSFSTKLYLIYSKCSCSYHEHLTDQLYAKKILWFLLYSYWARTTHLIYHTVLYFSLVLRRLGSRDTLQLIQIICVALLSTFARMYLLLDACARQGVHRKSGSGRKTGKEDK